MNERVVSSARLKQIIEEHLKDGRPIPAEDELVQFVSYLQQYARYYSSVDDFRSYKRDEALRAAAGRLMALMEEEAACCKDRSVELAPSFWDVMSALKSHPPFSQPAKSSSGRPREEWHLLAANLAENLVILLRCPYRKNLSVDTEAGPVVKIATTLLREAFGRHVEASSYAAAVKAYRRLFPVPCP